MKKAGTKPVNLQAKAVAIKLNRRKPWKKEESS